MISIAMTQISISAAIAAAALLILLPVGALAAAGDPPPLTALPGCVSSCGGVKVPYPFAIGTNASCYAQPGFNLTCDTASGGDARLLLDIEGNVQVVSISPYYMQAQWDGDIKIDLDADGNGNGTLSSALMEGGPYTLTGLSELILTGCNVQATVKSGNITIASCTSLCDDSSELDGPVAKDSIARCPAGRGCCRADLVINRDTTTTTTSSSSSTSAYDVQLRWLGGRNRSADAERLPVRVFVADRGWFDNSSVYNDLRQRVRPPSKDTMAVPFSVMWEFVGDAAVQPNLCKSNHSESSETRPGAYICDCKRGYNGIPFLTNGCQDVKYCERGPSYTGCYGECTDTNTGRGWTCRCPSGTTGDHAIPGGCVTIVANTGSCMASCGDIDVPYPFGIGMDANCYLPGLNLACDTSHDPPWLFLGSADFRVVRIFLANSTVRVTRTGALVSSNSSDGFTELWTFDGSFKGLLTGNSSSFSSGGVPYSLSTSNELVVTGCNAQAMLLGHGNPAVISGCASICSRSDTSSIGLGGGGKYCHGMGCCQARISDSMDGIPKELHFKWFDTTKHEDLPLPGYAFIAEEGWFEQQGDLVMRKGDLTSVDDLEVPILLRWEILHNGSSHNLSSHANCSWEVARDLCKSKFSNCKPGNRGYSCHCNEGNDGNPYVLDGCKGGRAKHFGGISIVIGVASGAGLILLVFIAYFISYKYKQRRSRNLKRKFFDQNRGQLLQQLVSQRADIAEKMIITLQELEKATNNFDKTRELGGGGHGTVYKGILSDLQVVAIKKPKLVVQKEIDEFINEVAILSQINHRNVVKLYGCCLETEVPMLVYEFISNGTLFEHLHVEGPRSLAWDNRLRIATEAAKSLAYLHSTALMPVIHRDVKSANILLDDTLTAKVADFGASRYIPLDKSGLTTMVQGTLGYLDPMYFYTGRLTEKSDVYSFGVMLIELMTRKKPSSYIASEGDGLVAHFAALFAEGNLLQILDPQVMKEGGSSIEEIAQIAVECIKLRAEERPTMRQVELRLEGVHSPDEHLAAAVEEVEVNYVAINPPPTREGRSGEGLTRQYSLEEEYMLSARCPR